MGKYAATAYLDQIFHQIKVKYFEQDSLQLL